MSLQTGLVLVIAALAAAYLVRDARKSSTGKGCASGCGACGVKDCALRKLEARLKEDKS
jgi:xanthine dehydrogenase iron-sulfur cluster and FAD-binding subunit A